MFYKRPVKKILVENMLDNFVSVLLCFFRFCIHFWLCVRFKSTLCDLPR